MSWAVDLTDVAQADLVGLEPGVYNAVMDAVNEWTLLGPPRDNRRDMAGMVFYEVGIANRYLLAYMIDDVRQRFVLMWLREKPGI